MKISNEQVRQVLQSYTREVDNDKKSAKSKQSGKGAAAQSVKADSVEITNRSNDIIKAKEAYNELPDVRSDLVNDLKSRIQSGNYDIPSKEVADKIIHRAIVDKTV